MKTVEISTTANGKTKTFYPKSLTGNYTEKIEDAIEITESDQQFFINEFQQHNCPNLQSARVSLVDAYDISEDETVYMTIVDESTLLSW